MQPSDFDWVKALSDCSLNHVFQQLRAEVEADVKSRNAQCPEGAGYKFSTIAKDNDLIVFLDGNGIPANRRVKFSKTSKTTAAFDGHNRTIFDAPLTLNDAGECRLRINGQEKEFWQARRMALEDLMFGDVWPESQVRIER